MGKTFKQQQQPQQMTFPRIRHQHSVLQDAHAERQVTASKQLRNEEKGNNYMSMPAQLGGSPALKSLKVKAV